MPDLYAVSPGAQAHAADLNQYQTALAGTFNVKSYGAKGDGTTDDVAAIQAAIDAAGAAGGGHVYFPPGTYKLIAYTTVTYTGGGTTTYHLRVLNDRITFRGVGRSSIIQSAANVNPFHLYKTPTSTSNWEFAHSLIPTVYLMGAAAVGDSSVTLTTHGQAANFAAGDYAFIRTGEVLDTYTQQPDSELNQVVSANAGTGVVKFRWPLSKSYAQEYFIAGTAGKTSTAVTANLALFGIANVTAHTLVDIAFYDLHFDGPTSVYAIIGSGIVGFTMERCSGVMPMGPLSLNIVRHGRVSNNRFEFTGSGAATYGVGIGYGTSDMTVSDNVLTGEHTPFVHIHEGWANAAVRGNIVSSPATATSSSETAVSVRGRAYDVLIEDNIIASAAGTGVFVDPDCPGGGVILGNIIRNATTAVETQCSGWLVKDNIGNVIQALVPPLVAQSRDVLSGWLIHGTTSVALGRLPANSVVVSIIVTAWTPFNSSGTDLISVGIASDHTKWAANIDVSGGYAVIKPTVTSVGWEYAAADVVAYYVAGGSAPSAGTCCISLEYIRIPSGAN